MHSPNSHTRAVEALVAALKTSQPDLEWVNERYLVDPEDNVLPLLRDHFWPQAKAQLLDGDGAELTGSGKRLPKFAAAHSSSALAVNSFGPWMGRSQTLRLDEITEFDGTLAFEAKCFNGVGPRPSNLDVMLGDGTAMYGVESKLTEWISPSKSRGTFSPAYAAIAEDDPRRHTNWFRTMESIADGSTAFSYLDAVQLVKHFFGLVHTYQDLPVRVVYIYWEPVNAADYPEFNAHRAEIDLFSEMVQGDGGDYLFESISYPEHWRELDEIADKPEWLPGHLEAVRARYEIEI